MGAAGQALPIDGFDVVEACQGSLAAFPDTLRFLDLLSRLDEAPSAPAQELPERRAARGLFDWQAEVVVARAPGRLDVMGGIADYSGSLVLQMPIAEACHVAVQRLPAGRERPQGGGSSPPTLRVVSFNAEAAHRGPAFEMPLADLMRDGRPLSYAEAKEYFRRDPALSWAAYAAGALVVLMHECGAEFGDGLSILVHSDVPEGKGVSSSAAIEVATMSALAAAYRLCLEGRQLALLCQMVENHVVGAPCGVMDQMASALGQEARLLALRCQPAEVQGNVAIPPFVKFWGVDSGIRHSVGGSDYGAVRVGTFMGRRIISQLAAGQRPLALQQQQQGAGSSSNGNGAQEAEAVGGGYLANVPPSQFAACFEQQLPEELQGADFLQQYGSHWDTATAVDLGQTYAVRTPTGHPIHENFRVHAFRQILLAHPPPSAHAAGSSSRAEQLEVLGELMYQSHASYSRCGLGSAGTDRLVELVREEHDAALAQGEAPVLFGAKITGGGCGGTVCILGVAGEMGEAALQRVAQRYAEESGHQPKLFHGSSAGALQFGHLRLRRRTG